MVLRCNETYNAISNIFVMKEKNGHVVRDGILGVLFPAYGMALIERKLDKRDFWHLALKNFVFFLFLTLLDIVVEQFVLHTFQWRVVVAYIAIDVVLALFFALLEFCWIKARKKDEEHFARYVKCCEQQGKQKE